MKIFASIALMLLPVAMLAQTAPSPSEEYLLLGTATRGAGEPMIAIDPTNSNNMIAVAMGNLHRIGAAATGASMVDAFHSAANSTITWLAVTHDGGATWKVGELPILSGKFTRCPDAFASATSDGTFFAGCEPRETSGEFFGESAYVISTDKGETWSKPVSLISSYGAKRFATGLKPRISGNSPWDRPFLYVDDSTGTIYAQAGGGETNIDTAPGKYRIQSYITASTDQGRSYGTIYAWDSAEYPQIGRGQMTAAHGTVYAAYLARSAPANEGQCAPCIVLGTSRDRGKTFEHHVLKHVPAPEAPERMPDGRLAPPGGINGGIAGLAADPTYAGRVALMVLRRGRYQVSVTEDQGKTWSSFTPAGHTEGASSLTKPWLEFSRKGVLGLMWRSIYAGGGYDIWSAISRDGGHSFSLPVRVSHAPSPAQNATRNGGRFGDDIQHLAMDEQNIHMVWGDQRAGFQGVWYGRIPLAAFTGAAH